MILSHMNAIEKVLRAQSSAAQNAGHPNLRGGPREWFVRDFLEAHLPSSVEIGQGEIIDEDSRPGPAPGDYRSQVDIVIYRQHFPRIRYSRNDCAYLAEGVVATIEVKSDLTKEDLSRACQSAHRQKNLTRSEPLFEWVPASTIWTYVLAYQGPENMATVARWLPEIKDELQAPSGSLCDLVVVLGKGVIWHTDAFRGISALIPGEGAQWAYRDKTEGNLFLLFSHMLTWAPYVFAPCSPLGYLAALNSEIYETI